MPPLRRAVLAGDEAGAVHATEVTVDEGVASLGLLFGAHGPPQVPGRVLVPAMGLEECVLVLGARLHFTPVAVQHVPAGIDELPGVRQRAPVDRVFSHAANGSRGQGQAYDIPTV